VLYAPALRNLDQIRAVCGAVSRPVNVLAGADATLAELEAAGVKRISVGSHLARLAYGGVIEAAKEMRENGSFTFARNGPSFAEIEAYF
jgi:2-methylisocitrate lyase-like PEP mutase family enzyme